MLSLSLSIYLSIYCVRAHSNAIKVIIVRNVLSHCLLQHCYPYGRLKIRENIKYEHVVFGLLSQGITEEKEGGGGKGKEGGKAFLRRSHSAHKIPKNVFRGSLRHSHLSLSLSHTHTHTHTHHVRA